MRIQTYNRINSFFKKHTEARANEIDFVFRKVNDVYFSNIADRNPDGTVIEKTEEEKNTIENTITSDDNLSSYLDNAKKFYIDYDGDQERLFRKKIGRESFFRSLGSNMLANFLYSLVIILIFIVAKDQIQSWLMSINK